MGMVIIVGAFLLVCLYLGLRHSKDVTNLKEFALGYKKISTPLLIATIYATYLGAGSTLGFIEQINNIGIVCIIIAVVNVCNWYLSRAIFCNDLSRFHGCLSQVHIMEKLYGQLGLWVSSLVTLIISVGTVAIQILVIGYIIQYFSLLPLTMGILIGAGVVTLYAASGGIKAVVITDLAQAIVFVVVIATVFLLSMQKIATQPDFFNTLPENKLWVIPYDWDSLLLLVGMVVWALVPIGYDAPFIQRILISGSETQLRKAFSYVALIDLVVVISISAIAILLLPTTGEGTVSKAGLFEVINTHMHPLIVGMTVVGILAVTMSTADSWLNAAAVIVAHDMAKKYNPDLTDTESVTIARLATIFIGMCATALALSNNSVLSLLLMADNFVPVVLIPVAAGFLGYQCTANDFKRSIFGAITGVVLGGYFKGELGFVSMLFGLIGSTIGLSWKKKWDFRLPDGTPLIGLPKFRQITPMFSASLFGLGLVHTLVHMCLDQTWYVGELASPFCLLTALSGVILLVYSEIDKRWYYFCTSLSVMLLIAGIASFALRAADLSNIAYLIFTIIVVCIYRQYMPALLGLVLAGVSTHFWYAIAHTPVIPLGAMPTIFLGLGVFCTYVYFKDANEQLQGEKMLALTDELTGLYNRRYLESKLHDMVRHAHARSRNLAVIIFDVDYFNKLNNTYGHESGDLVLQQLGRRIKNNARPVDECMRFAGEKFMIAMPDTSLEQAVNIAERLRDMVDHVLFTLPVKPGSVKCTISVGVGALQADDNVESLIAHVETALYVAKSKGRNRVVSTLELEAPTLGAPIAV